MNEKEVLTVFKKTGAFLEGHFKLSSGLHSGRYLQCAKVLQYPTYAEKLCTALAEKFTGGEIDTVIAPALGGILVSYEVARALNAKSVFTERVEGKMALRRGFTLKKNEKVLVVEDIVTTGLSTRGVIDTVKSFGASLVGVGCIIDRSKGKAVFGARFESLSKIDIPTYESRNCPLCKDRIPVTNPGSRSLP